MERQTKNAVQKSKQSGGLGLRKAAYAYAFVASYAGAACAQSWGGNLESQCAAALMATATVIGFELCADRRRKRDKRCFPVASTRPSP